MKYLFPNPEQNEWIAKYNDLVKEIASNEKANIEYKKTQPKRDDKNPGQWTAASIGIHHIIPKKVNPSLEKDKDNLLYVNFADHCMLHYYLWKSDPIYAPHLWFICIAGRKMGIWDLPNGQSDYDILKKDVGRYRAAKKKQKGL